MSDLLRVNSDIASERFKGPQTGDAREKARQSEMVAKQNPSAMTGLQWAQVTPQVSNGAKPVAGDKAAKNFELVKPSLEDVAVLSTTVSMNDEAVEAPRPGLIMRTLSSRINMGALESSFREYFKKSRSHNLLLERFMSNVKFSAIKSLMSLMGVSAAEMAKIQSEVRDEALKEIDSKLKNDWAYTKAMLEITQG